MKLPVHMICTLPGMTVCLVLCPMQSTAVPAPAGAGSPCPGHPHSSNCQHCDALPTQQICSQMPTPPSWTSATSSLRQTLKVSNLQLSATRLGPVLQLHSARQGQMARQRCLLSGHSPGHHLPVATGLMAPPRQPLWAGHLQLRGLLQRQHDQQRLGAVCGALRVTDRCTGGGSAATA
jgi:hypothetical protein